MLINKITSLTNSRIKNIVLLRNRKNRIDTGLTIIEGEKELTRALEVGVRFEEVYVCRKKDAPGSAFVSESIVKKFQALRIPVYETTENVFSKIAYGNRCEGVLAVGALKSLSLNDLPIRTPSLYVIVERIEKPGNLGAILRTCDGAGVDGIIICDGKTDITNPNVIRASLGTIFSTNVVISSNAQAYDFLKANKIAVCATLPQAKSMYTDEHLTNSIAVVLGSEEKGLSDFWVEHADLKVKIPMHGKSDSLNVSVSTAILLYEILRQRSK